MAFFGEAVFLEAAGGFVGDGARQPASIYERLQIRFMVRTKQPPFKRNSGSGKPVSRQRRIMSPVPVPIRSMYLVR